MSSQGSGDPAWLSEATRIVVEEAILYLRTVGTFLARPARFVDGWLRRDRSMNPLGVVASTVTVLAIAQRLAMHLASAGDVGAGFVREGLQLPIPYLFFAAVGAVAHTLAGRPLQRMASSVAMSLYAGAAGNLLLGLLTTSVILVLRLGKGYVPQRGLVFNLPIGARIPAVVVLLGVLLWQYASLLVALRALHRSSFLRMALSLAAGIAFGAFAMAAIHRATGVKELGFLHPVLWYDGWFDIVS